MKHLVGDGVARGPEELGPKGGKDATSEGEGGGGAGETMLAGGTKVGFEKDMGGRGMAMSSSEDNMPGSSDSTGRWLGPGSRSGAIAFRDVLVFLGAMSGRRQYVQRREVEA